MTLVRALTRFDYGRRQLRPGDEIEIANEADVRVLQAALRVSPVGSDAEPQQKRRYRRRDMRSEE